MPNERRDPEELARYPAASIFSVCVHSHFLSVELYNSQAMLKGSESEGYVVVSAAKASLLSCDHKPVWKNQQEVRSKMTLVGSIESMQVRTAPCGLSSIALATIFSIMPQLRLKLLTTFDGWLKNT